MIRTVISVIRPLPHIIFISLLILIFATGSCILPKKEYDALETFYYGAGGPSWCWNTTQFQRANATIWKFDDYMMNNPCANNWVGVTCDCVDDNYAVSNIRLSANCLYGTLSASLLDLEHLRGLSVHENMLYGTIPDFLGSFTNIQTIDLATNYFNGSLPYSIFNASRLYVLNLYDNMLSGSLSQEFSKFTRIQFISLYENYFVGTIPHEIFALTSLNTLALEFNLMTGTISNAIGQLTGLYVLKIGNNYFEKTIPESLYHLTDLRVLYLRSNSLTGTLSSAIENLHHLINFEVYDNMLHHTIPSNIFTLTRLSSLGLDGNLFTGQIPNNVSVVNKMQSISMYDNYLTGTIPPSLSSIQTMKALLLYQNYLTGTLPQTLGGTGNRTILEYLVVDTNYLSGSIPPDLFTYATRLIYLYLYSNSFSDVLPANIGGIRSLVDVLLYDNLLSGPFFEYFSHTDHIPRLQIVNIANNLFSGSLPSYGSFFNSPVRALSISSNCFTGTIPEIICNLDPTRIQVLNMDGIGNNLACRENQRLQSYVHISFVKGSFSALGFTGTIPTCLFQVKSLQTLHISGNNLLGRIPSLHDQAVLDDLTLSNNALTGTIPISIQLHAFTSLDLSANRLHGTLDSEFVVSPYQQSLALAVNRLSGDLPPAIRSLTKNSHTNITSLNVLSTNIFSCDLNKDLQENIPSLDVYADSYSCGSSELEIASYITLSIAVIFAILVCCLCYCRTPSFHRLYHQSTIWWEVSIALLLDKKEGQTRFLVGTSDLSETKAYFLHIQLLASLTLIIGVLLILCFIPIYAMIGLLSNASIVSYQYGYAVSMAFLHGIAPVIFIGFIIFILLSCFMLITAASKGMMLKAFGQTKPKITDNYRRFIIQKYLLLSLVHIINLSMTLLVNLAYVNAILTDAKLTRSGLLAIQIFVGMFKLLWNILYIPWCSIRLASFMSHPRSMQNRLLMSITNYILAPVVATAAVNQSCFYYIFKEFPPQISSIDITLCGGYGCCVPADDCGICCKTSVPVIFTSSTVPSFQYSYACGTAIIVTYVPVLLYAYAAYGFIIPILRYLSAIRTEFSFLKVLMKKNETPGCVFGRNSIVNIILHMTVLMTFGIASPILGIVIVVAIINDCLMSLLLAGKYMISLAKVVPNDNNDNNKSSTRYFITPTLKQYNDVDMKDAWRGLYACYWTIIMTVCIFWGILFIDMIADQYGWTNGIILAAIYGIALPIGFIIVRKYLRHYIIFDPLMKRIIKMLCHFFHFDSIALLSREDDIVGVAMNPMLSEVQERHRDNSFDFH